MKKHQYRVMVEHVADKEGNPIQREPLQFSAPNLNLIHYKDLPLFVALKPHLTEIM